MAKDAKKLLQENEQLKKIIVALDKKTKQQVEDLESQVKSITEELTQYEEDMKVVVDGEKTSTNESSLIDKYKEELGIK